MKAVILAAGEGARLKRYTREAPKCMLPVGGRPILERQVSLLRRAGIDRIAVVTGFRANAVPTAGLVRYHNPDFSSTNMVASLLCARAEFDDDLLVIYGDVLFDGTLLGAVRGAEGPFAAAVDVAWEDYWRFRYGRTDLDTESLSLSADGRITELGRSDVPPERMQGRYVGVLKFSREGLGAVVRLLDEARATAGEAPWQVSGRPLRQAYMTDLLQALIERGHPVRAATVRGGWIEFDTPEDYERTERLIREGGVGRFLRWEDVL